MGRLTPTELRRLYVDDEKTDHDIAGVFGVTAEAVGHYRKAEGVATLTPRMRRDRRRRLEGLPVLHDLTPAELISLYQSMGDRAIAKRFGVTKPTVAALRKKLGITPISKTERATSVEPFTLEQEEAVYGVLLGDGFVSPSGWFKVWHSHAQLDYVRQVHRILSPFSKPVGYSEKVMASGTLTYAFGFRTVQHVWLKQVRELFYPEGVKVFPESVLMNLAPRSLAFWYFDDGHLDSGLPTLALGDVSDGSVDLVFRCLKDRFGLDAYLSPRTTPTCKIVALRASCLGVFFPLILPYAGDDLLYKFPAKYRKDPSRRMVHPSLTLEPKPLPKALVQAASSWKEESPGKQDSIVERFLGFWRQEGFPYPVPNWEELRILIELDQEQVLRDGKARRINAGQSICGASMPRLWGVRSKGRTKAPRELFEDDNGLRAVLRMLLGLGQIPNASRLRSGFQMFRFSGVYNFRPAVAKALVDRFCPRGGLVFDPCAGWGGRLLGSVLSNSQARYVACEPQPGTLQGLQGLVQEVGGYLPDVPGRVGVHGSPMEDFDWPGGVDLVMTSPPYWKKEEYGPEPELAGNRFQTYESWVEGFYRVLFRKAAKALKPGGWLVLNVDDVVIGNQRCPLIEDALRLAREFGFGEPQETYLYDMAKPGSRENHEKVFCWSLLSRARPANVESSGEVQVANCSGCGRLVEEGEELCRSCASKAVANIRDCDECGKPYEALRKKSQFCSQTCGARNRRRRKRKEGPIERAFKCRLCKRDWATVKPGNFHWCPECQGIRIEANERAARTKVCGFRACGQEFVDTSSQNSMRFCCPKHRDAEKRLRLKV